MTPLSTQPDHLVVAAINLEEGCDWIERRLGERPRAGGSHDAMGTHNALLSLGPRFYLEVIAIDPAAGAPPRPRWFDLDSPAMKSELSQGPRLIHWVVRTCQLDTIALRIPELGVPMSMSRGAFTWRICVPEDGRLPGQGLVPAAIEWPDARHPSDGLRDTGMRLVALAGELADPAPVRSRLAQLGQSETMKVTSGRSPRIVAMIRTPRGSVML